MATASDVFDVKDLSGADRDRLVRRLYPVHEAVFANSDLEDFRSYLVKDDTVSSRVQVLEAEGEPVGFGVMHVYRLVVRGQALSVVRFGIGLRKEHRGSQLMSRFGASELTRHRLANPSVPMYLLNFCVHPSSYALLNRYSEDYAPRPDAVPSDEQTALVRELLPRVGARWIDDDDPWIVDSHWITRVSPEEATYWARCSKPSAAFFRRRNPNFARGHSLVVLTRLTIADLVRGVGRKRLDQVRKGGVSIAAALQARGLGTGVATGRAREILQAAPQFRGARPETLAALADAATLRTVPARKTLVRQGDTGDCLYIVVRGAADVWIQVGAKRVLIDTVDEGTVLGETSVLVNEPRTATVIATTDLVVLRLEAEDVLRATHADPELAASLWRETAQRLVEQLLVLSPRYSAVIEPFERAAIGRSPTWWLPAGSARRPGGGLLALISGDVEVEDGAHYALLSAPALLGTGQEAILRTRSGACLVPLPELEAIAAAHAPPVRETAPAPQLR